MKLDDYFEFISETAYLAGRLTLGYYQIGVRPDFKADDTPVTAADRAAEQLIRQRIESRYPTHAIVGEEFGGSEQHLDNPFCWYIDPIDGTKAFMRGVPLYAVLIGLEIEGRVEVGAAYFPALDEMIVAASGMGCWWNGRRAHVSTVENMDRAYMSFTDPGAFVKYGRGDAFGRLQAACYHRVGWSDAYGYLLAATGRVEVMLDPIMADWDCGPFPPIFREAGGYFGDWQGNETIHSREGLGTSTTLLPQVVDLLKD